MDAYSQALGVIPKNPMPGSALLTQSEQAQSDQKERNFLASKGGQSELNEALRTASPKDRADILKSVQSVQADPYADALGIGSQPSSAPQVDPAFRGVNAIPTKTGANTQTTVEKPESFTDKVIGAAQTLGNLAAGTVGGVVGPIAGVANDLYQRTFNGAPSDNTIAEQTAGKVAGAIQSVVPNNDAARRYTETVGKVLEPLGAIGPMAEFGMLASQVPVVKRTLMDEWNARNAPEVPPKPLYRMVDGKWQQVDPKTAPPQAASFDAAPVDGGLPQVVQSDRAKVLQKIGLDNVRSSAVTGDKAQAAVDYQISQFKDQKAGQMVMGQLDKERNALESYGRSAIDSTGGTAGLSQDAVHARGKEIVSPLDQYGNWFKKSYKELYQAADDKSGGLPVVTTQEVGDFLNNPDFKNAALAQDKLGFVNGVKGQLEAYAERNPGGLTVKNVEQFKQWLNKQWTPENKWFIGQVQDALDNAVMKSAGEDIYAKARQVFALKKQTLDNPKGIAKIIGYDSQTPINRRTPFENIPDAVTRLDPDQLKNLLDTYRNMPAELQPAAQKAISQIQAQYANKMIDAASNNKGQWNAKNLTDYRLQNNQNIVEAFKNNPEALDKLSTLESAGHILTYPTQYPGAAAQADMAMRQGLLPKLVQKAGVWTGGAVGGTVGGLLGAPVAGATGGAAIGEAASSRASQGMAERAAVKRIGKRIVDLSEAK